jgi:hypothetical protein
MLLQRKRIFSGTGQGSLFGSVRMVFAAQTYNYEMEGFVRAISGHGTVHHSGA